MVLKMSNFALSLPQPTGLLLNKMCLYSCKVRLYTLLEKVVIRGGCILMSDTAVVSYNWRSKSSC